MSTAHVLFESVAPIWVLWATAGAALIVLAWRARPRPGPGRVPDPEGGFDYTVNLVATLPALGLLICLVVETTTILTTTRTEPPASNGPGRWADLPFVKA